MGDSEPASPDMVIHPQKRVEDFLFFGGDSLEKSRKQDWQYVILDKARSEEAVEDDKA